MTRRGLATWTVVLSALVALLAVFGGHLFNMCQQNAEHVRHVLPKNVTPKHYDLTLTPDLVNFTFAGEVEVKVTINEPTNEIHLNYKELDLIEAAVTLQDGSRHVAKAIELDQHDEVAMLKFDTALAPQQAVVYVKFTGTLNDKMAGFYRSGYENSKGERVYLGTTQFEAADARRAFPCWDEPALKATFNVTLRVPKDLTALSNMDPIATRDIDGGLKEVKFDETPIMSTYLLAFVVGEFDYVEGFTKENVRIRIYCPPGLSSQGAFALKVGTETLSFFTEYFGIPYPLPKLDMVAIPDFAAGAMENWGLVTYRKVLLLFDEHTTPVIYKQRIAYVVGHELAHQWFGNLVTMEWWTDLWLNEGFATWVGWLAVDHIFPEWKVWEQFVSNEQKRGLTLDGLKSSHPIQVEVNHVRQVDEIFDAISYAKGASVILMLATFLGEKSFRAGLHDYLNKFKYSNAKTADLWAALSQSSGIDVGSMMDTWTKQMGYPVVEVDERGDQIHVKQLRYLSTGKEESDPAMWAIPLRVISPEHAPAMKVLKEREATFDLPAAHDKWWKVNAYQAGFYRVQYSNVILPKLGKAIEAKEISVQDRVGIVNDVFALASAGYCSTDHALEILQYYKNEDDTTVWTDITKNLAQLASVMYREDEGTRNRLRAYRRQLYAPIAEQLGLDVKESDSHLTKMLRTIMIQAAGIAQVPSVVDECKKRFAQYVAGDHNCIHPDLLSPVFTVTLANGDDKVFDDLVKLYDEAKTDDAKVTILSLIGSGGSEHLVQRALDMIFTERVRAQDAPTIWVSCSANPLGRDLTWRFTQENWDRIYEQFASGSFLLGRIVAAATNTFVTEQCAKDVETFFAAQNCDIIERTISQCTETIRANASWLSRDRASIKAWLEKKIAA